jgi:macrolide transport system ATP-binding/permease protein
LQSLIQDVRYSSRLLIKDYRFTAIVALSLALGIGGNTALFSIVNALLLRPTAVKEPNSLMAIYTSDENGYQYGGSSYPDYLDFQERGKAFSGIVAYASTPLGVTWGGRTERAWGELVSGNYFSVLGITAFQGNTFNPDQAKIHNAYPVVVVSYKFWRRWLNADPGSVGRTLVLNGNNFTIIGVAPESFAGLQVGVLPDLWIPLTMQTQVMPGPGLLDDRSARWLSIVGRLTNDAEPERAMAEFNLLANQQRNLYPEPWSNISGESRTITIQPERESRLDPSLRGGILEFITLLWAIIGLVLIVACANVANLLLGRSVARRKETAIRLALGAQRGRLIRQLLTESIMLSLIGGLVGLLLAFWGTTILQTFKPPISTPLTFDFSIDMRVLLFTLLVSVITGIVFGLVPATQSSKPDMVHALKDESAVSGRVHKKYGLRNLLVIFQVALSLTLLIGAGLFVRSLQNANSVDLGFQADNVLLTSFDLHLGGYNAAKGRSFYEHLLERGKSLPGVQNAALARVVPLGLDDQPRRAVLIENRLYTPGEDTELYFNVVGPGYFPTLGIPVLQGRDFTDQDREGAPGVVIVNETMARHFWPGENPIGKRLRLGGGGASYLNVVGVVKDSKYLTLGELPQSYYFLPFLQHYEPRMTLHLRAAGDPKNLIGAIRHEAQLLNASLPVFDIKTLSQHLSVSLFVARVAASLTGFFGLLAVTLASIGLYGVISYFVTQRTKDIGILAALGARPNDILKLVIGQGMTLVLIGLGLGLAISFAVTRLLKSFLYGVTSTDFVTFSLASILLVGIAFLACYLPAGRAMKIDPSITLRSR